jgi:hypothetical protein
MNPYIKAIIVVLGAILVPMGAGMSAGIHDWYVIGGGMATAGASAIAGVFVRLPGDAARKNEWTDEERAAKLGEVK